MKIQSTYRNGWGTLGSIILPIILALIFLAFTFSYYPFREKLQFDSDEGLNLMRSMLVALGHPLYSEVSSDQPPLFTHLLGLLFRVVGFEVNPGRLLVLLFSTLLIWAGAQFLQLTSGKLAAVLFLPVAIMVPRFLELSISVMIGVPAIALATVSMVFVTLWHQKSNNLCLVLSGVVLALSMLIKLFTGFLAPIFLAGITASAYYGYRGREEGYSWKLIRPALIWTISFASAGILLGLVLVGPQNISLIIFPHVAASTVEEFQGESNTINAQLQAAAPLIFLGIAGALVSISKRNWLALYPLAWAILAYILFNFHSPIFYHHQLLITIPMAMNAAAGVAEGLPALTQLRRPSDVVSLPTLLGIGALIGFVLMTRHYLPVLNRELSNSPQISGFNLRATPGKLKVLRTMGAYIDQTQWIMTDMPMYAFRVQRPVPPALATFSRKRLVTGSLTEEDILTAMDSYHPEQVLMARFEIPALEAYLQENYTLILSEEFFRLFIRNDIKPVAQ